MASLCVACRLPIPQDVTYQVCRVDRHHFHTSCRCPIHPNSMTTVNSNTNGVLRTRAHTALPQATPVSPPQQRHRHIGTWIVILIIVCGALLVVSRLSNQAQNFTTSSENTGRSSP